MPLRLQAWIHRAPPATRTEKVPTRLAAPRRAGPVFRLRRALCIVEAQKLGRGRALAASAL
jgi:hypothetical protein